MTHWTDYPEPQYQCPNKICVNYNMPQIPKNPNPYTGKLLDCHNCNFELEEVEVEVEED